MREITRIHIAKIAYDIEIDAKKDLEKYIKDLEIYASDQEILDDIEIRITELLAEQGVAAGGVISKADVVAVRTRLGEPSEFASEEVIENAINKSVEALEPRRIYRDENDAILGGVLAGVAKFFGIDPLWVRLVFIVVLLVSFGTALVVYLILWLIIPPAKTAAEKLRMSGQSVTLASIKEFAASEEQRSEVAHRVRRLLSILAGSFLVLMAISGLIAIITVIFGVQFGAVSGEFGLLYNNLSSDSSLFNSWWYVAAMGLFIVSGLLFSALCFILASAAFRRQWSKRIVVAVIAIITAGLVLFASGVGVGMYGYAVERERIAELRESVTIDLPVKFMDIKTITFSGSDEIRGDIIYTVSDKSYYTLDALPGAVADIQISDDGSSATIGLTGKSEWMEAPRLTIYGPAVEKVNLETDTSTVFYKGKGEQKILTINADGSGARFNLSGNYSAVSVMGDAYSSVALESAAIGELSVEGGGVRAGGVRELSVTQPDVCPSHSGYAGSYSVTVQGVSSGRLTYNGKEQPAKSIENSCDRVVIGNEYGSESEW